MKKAIVMDLHAGMSALELAEAFHASCGPRKPDPQHLEMVQNTLFLAGQHLSDLGTAGEWHRFEASSFWGKVAFLSAHEKEGMLITLIGFFSWLALLDLIELDVGLAILHDLEEVDFPSPVAAELCKKGRRALVHIRNLQEDDVPSAELPGLN